MSSNYPDDIRLYDNDPRSPFYTQPLDSGSCRECGAFFHLDDLKDGLCKICEQLKEGEKEE